MKRLIIYDLDGTLVDTKEDLASATNYMLQGLGRAQLPRPEVWQYVGKGLRRLVGSSLDTDDAKMIERGMGIFSSYYEKHLLDRSVLYPGAVEALEYFSMRRQAVVTNKPDGFSQAILIGLGIADFFFAIIGGESGLPKKPNPAAIQALMEKQKVRPDETLILGDSPVDIEAGHNAGVDSVGITQGFSDDSELAASGADALVRNFAEFLELAKGRSW